MYDIKDNLNDIKKIRYLNKDCEELHITKSISKKDLQKIINKCKKLKLITVSKSTKNRMSKNAKKILTDKKIKLYIKKEQGRAIEINIEKLKKIIKMYKDHSYRELSDKLNVPKSTIHYLIKYSKRKKIKEGNKIIYLK
jgi:hypothetical protein